MNNSSTSAFFPLFYEPYESDHTIIYICVFLSRILHTNYSTCNCGNNGMCVLYFNVARMLPEFTSYHTTFSTNLTSLGELLNSLNAAILCDPCQMALERELYLSSENSILSN